MIKTLVVMLTATFTAPLLSSAVMAQGDQAQPAGIVAVLDVAKVFKENAQFDQRMEDIKKEAEALKIQIQSEQEAIRRRAQGVSEFEVGSTDRNELEATIEQDQATLRTKARQSETDLLNREAQIYYATYSEIQKVVEKIAQQNGISLVLRYDSSPIDRDNRPEVIKGVNRAVLYHHKLDLTTMVIESLGPRAADAGGGQTQRK